jgi:hypothetical protein
MANAFVSIVRKLNKSGELRKRLEGDHPIVYDGPITERKASTSRAAYAAEPSPALVTSPRSS